MQKRQGRICPNRSPSQQHFETRYKLLLQLSLCNVKGSPSWWALELFSPHIPSHRDTGSGFLVQKKLRTWWVSLIICHQLKVPAASVAGTSFLTTTQINIRTTYARKHVLCVSTGLWAPRITGNGYLYSPTLKFSGHLEARGQYTVLQVGRQKFLHFSVAV